MPRKKAVQPSPVNATGMQLERELRASIAELTSENERLRAQYLKEHEQRCEAESARDDAIEERDSAINDAEANEDAAAIGSHAQEQLDSLRVALESGRASVPQTSEQWQRCIREILDGNEWENGTWK